MRAWWRSCVSASAQPGRRLPAASVWVSLGRETPRRAGESRSSPSPALHRTERQHRDLAYCVSQLPLTERGLHKMLDNFDCFGNKLSDESIFSAFLSVVSKLRRGAKPESKVSHAGHCLGGASAGDAVCAAVTCLACPPPPLLRTDPRD